MFEKQSKLKQIEANGSIREVIFLLLFINLMEGEIIMYSITLDAGHQSSPNADTGCSGFGLREEDIVLDICKRAKQLIELNGIKVIMTREGAKVNGDGSSLNASLNTRCQIANSNKTDLFLSCHCDAFNSQAFGTTCHVFGLNGKAEKFAKILNPMMGQLFYNRGIKVSNFAVIRDTNMPAILLETAFLDNKEDNAKLANANIRQQIAVNIAKSVCTYFGVTYKEGVVNKVSDVAIKVDKDVYLTVRVLESKSEEVIKQIIKMGYATKRLELA